MTKKSGRMGTSSLPLVYITLDVETMTLMEQGTHYTHFELFAFFDNIMWLAVVHA